MTASRTSAADSSSGNASMQDDDVVFVCGALRSGTTLLRLMINDHPALSNPGEMDFLFEPPGGDVATADMAAYARHIEFNRVFKATGLKFQSGLDFTAQVRDFVDQLRRPGKRLSINVHRHFDRIPAIFPNARFVHLLRDPRDVAKSSIGMGWAGNVYHGVDHWIASERDFARLGAMVAPDRIHTIRNEELIVRPEDVLARLCAFLGVAYDKAMLDYPSHTTYSRPDPRLIEQWRRELSPADLALVEGKVGPMLAERGYSPSGVPPHTPDAAKQSRLRWQNRLGRWRFLTRRNGPILVGLDAISRRLPLPGLRRFVRARLAERDLRHIK